MSNELTVKSLEDQLAAARAATYIPGEYRCQKCGFVLMSSVMNPETGDVGANQERPKCPNDGALMYRVTWAQAAREARDHAIASMGIVNMINALREREGSSVTILCENPEGSGSNKQAVLVSDDWTDWTEMRFDGETVADALSKALEKRAETIKPDSNCTGS